MGIFSKSFPKGFAVCEDCGAVFKRRKFNCSAVSGFIFMELVEKEGYETGPFSELCSACREPKIERKRKESLAQAYAVAHLEEILPKAEKWAKEEDKKLRDQLCPNMKSFA